MKNNFNKSETLLKKALNIIPLGSQTYNKSSLFFPYGVSPYFIEKGKGAHVWDVDGNKYIDFINASMAIILGYRDPDVDKAVVAQMNNGVIFSLSHALEVELASKLIEMIPCAEMVRFCKNGSDVTTGAVKLARAYTKREHVIIYGYHGWHDWYMCATAKTAGIPKTLCKLTHRFKYNDINSLKKIFNKYPGKVAAIIMEPMNIEFPKDDFLSKVKEIAHNNGALLIFDEMITGFRFSEGGAQKLFSVIPDLACFGKALANGYPLSALVGKKEIMKLIEDQVFFSLTFGGETLSLAAGLATLEKIQEKKVIESIFKKGTYLINGVNELIYKHQLSKVITIKGHPSWSFLVFNKTDGYSGEAIETYHLQELFKRKILGFARHVISFSHTQEDIDYLLSVYDEIFELIKERLKKKDLFDKLKCKIPMVFKTRF